MRPAANVPTATTGIVFSRGLQLTSMQRTRGRSLGRGSANRATHHLCHVRVRSLDTPPRLAVNSNVRPGTVARVAPHEWWLAGSSKVGQAGGGNGRWL